MVPACCQFYSDAHADFYHTVCSVIAQLFSSGQLFIALDTSTASSRTTSRAGEFSTSPLQVFQPVYSH